MCKKNYINNISKLSEEGNALESRFYSFVSLPLSFFPDLTQTYVELANIILVEGAKFHGNDRLRFDIPPKKKSYVLISNIYY